VVLSYTVGASCARRGLRAFGPTGTIPPRMVTDVAMDPVLRSDAFLLALRAGRLERLQRAMADHGAEACLFFNQANVRYATGTAAMTVYSDSAFVRCAVVPVEGSPILFEHPKLVERARRIVADVRPMHAWEFTDDPASHARVWVDELLDGTDLPGRLFVDKLGAPAIAALQERGVSLADAAPVTLDAREVKTTEELQVIEHNARIGEAMLATFEESLKPGVREQELLAEVTRVLLRSGGEHLISRACVSGPNTNPWNLEASDRAIESGDVAFLDTDAIGVEGYLIDVSRTFLCGDVAPTLAQRDAYRAAHEWLMGARPELRAGRTMREIAGRLPALPDRYRAQRYEVMAHQAGLEDEGPSVAYPEDEQPNGDRVLKPNSVVCLEVYCGDVGGRDGVKLEDQVLVTEGEPRVLVEYPFSDVLLA
jgi:Xaa-Pro dipeptidase